MYMTASAEAVLATGVASAGLAVVVLLTVAHPVDMDARANTIEATPTDTLMLFLLL